MIRCFIAVEISVRHYLTAHFESNECPNELVTGQKWAFNGQPCRHLILIATWLYKIYIYGIN